MLWQSTAASIFVLVMNDQEYRNSPCNGTCRVHARLTYIKNSERGLFAIYCLFMLNSCKRKWQDSSWDKNSSESLTWMQSMAVVSGLRMHIKYWWIVGYSGLSIGLNIFRSLSIGLNIFRMWVQTPLPPHCVELLRKTLPTPLFLIQVKEWVPSLM